MPDCDGPEDLGMDLEEGSFPADATFPGTGDGGRTLRLPIESDLQDQATDRAREPREDYHASWKMSLTHMAIGVYEEETADGHSVVTNFKGGESMFRVKALKVLAAVPARVLQACLEGDLSLLAKSSAEKTIVDLRLRESHQKYLGLLDDMPDLDLPHKNTKADMEQGLDWLSRP